MSKTITEQEFKDMLDEHNIEDVGDIDYDDDDGVWRATEDGHNPGCPWSLMAEYVEGFEEFEECYRDVCECFGE